MRRFIFFIILLHSLFSCINPDESKQAFLKGTDFDPDSRVLVIHGETGIDTALQQVIILSGIRNEGYGVLLNINQAASQQEIDSLKYKFRKQDINAVHDFDIQFSEPVANHVILALEGAKFVWLFLNEEFMGDSAVTGKVEKVLSEVTAHDGILVKPDNQ